MRKGIGLVVALLVVAVAGSAAALWWGVPVTLGPDRIQGELERAFPVERSTGILDVVLTNPEVLSDGAGRLRIRMDLAASSKVFAADYEGTTLVSGRLRWDPEAGALHVVDARVDDLTVTGLKPAEKTALTQILSRQLARRLEREPILSLDPEGSLRERLARRFVRRVEIEDDGVKITLGFR